MKQIKVKVKYDFAHPHMKEILPLGFETEIQPILSTKDKVVVREQTRLNKQTGKHEVVIPATIQPAGSYEGYNFVGANGLTYDDKVIEHAIGIQPLSKIFDKI